MAMPAQLASLIVASPFEYHAVRVLISVLFTAAAPTRIRTSLAVSLGTGISLRTSSLSSSPWPVSHTPFIDLVISFIKIFFYF